MLALSSEQQIARSSEVNMKLRPLKSPQIRAARSLLRSAQDLAKEAALGLATVRRAENTEDETSLTVANDLAIRRALEAAGIDSSTRMAADRAAPAEASARPK